MSPAPLLLDELPPLRVPLRFFLTAPAFGILGGLVWLLVGEEAFAARWSQGTLAATHLFTLGCMAMVMVGALFQVVPVLGGGAIPQATRVAPAVHAGLTAGTLCLAYGLYWFAVPWLAAALVLLGGSFLLLLPLLGWRVFRRGSGKGLYTVRFALLSLLVTIGLGLVMASAMVWPGLGIRFRESTDAHAAFGLGGWVLLLIVGVGHQVVPMFHVTPPFPGWLVRTTGPAVFAGLLLVTLGRHPALVAAGATLAAAAALLHAATTLGLLARRRRRRPEPVVRAWQWAMGWLLLAAALGWKTAVLPGLRLPLLPLAQEPLLLAVVFGFGFALTVILGMLGKVVPFLAFTHLQRRCLETPAAMSQLPAMNEIVTEREAFWQLGLHAATGLAAAAAVLAPGLGRLAGLLVALDFGLCLRNLLAAVGRYRRAAAAISPGSPPAGGAPWRGG